MEHDIHYWCGGNAEDRRRADRELRDCVSLATGGVLPDIMHASVRIGGAPWQPVPWRWGYGWGYYRAYDTEGDAPLQVEPRSSVAPGGATPNGSRPIVFGRGQTPVDVPVYARASLGAGATFSGPAIVEERETTSVIRPEWRVEVAADGTLVASRERP